ncbi:MAG TPA: TetR/AcrR family transcriptional regulator [Caulobacteraceae bacterium]|jgi:AcrR family transcriptional regulator|nr:TetR/AcrR family transcriptional regulator [Caulobacteraceae bacterium]
MVKPLSRKRQRTRAALVEATLALIAERGLDGVTLDEVAARAGVTKGAIYSNYRSKGELLWDAVDTRRLHLRPRMISDARAQAREMARAFMAQLPQAEREATFYSELQSYIRTDPELREQQAAQQKAQFDWIAEELQATFGERLAYPARVVGLAVQALALGFMAQWERTPDEVTEDVVAAAYEALAVGATRRQTGV